MTIEVYSATGENVTRLTLPETLFQQPVNWGLIHQAITMEEANRRASIAHSKTRGEIRGSTRKVYAQKHTGRARRGPIRSPLLKGGGKAFGPRSVRNFAQRMPRAMRHAALRAALSAQARKGAILGLQNYPDTIKTKDAAAMLRRLPIDGGRRLLIVLPGEHRSLHRSARNIPGVHIVRAAYLNPRDVLAARHLLFLVDAISVAERLFGRRPSSAPSPSSVPSS